MNSAIWIIIVLASIILTYFALRPRIVATLELNERTAQENEEIEK
jgi:hypothetical protein